MAVAVSLFARDDASAAESIERERGEGRGREKKKHNSYQQDVVVTDRKSALTAFFFLFWREQDALQGDSSNCG